MQREGPGLFRCKLGVQNNEHYQNLIKNVIKNELYLALTPSQKNVLEHALFKTRAFLQNEMHKIKDDPTQYTKVTNLNFQIALLMSMEATEHELLQRELECSLAVLHETVLKKN